MIENYPPKIPHPVYPDTLPEQETALAESDQLTAYKEYREKMQNTPYEPSYHFTAPDGMINDPNGLCIWQGKCHMFYQAYPPADFRQHWGHTVSDDMVNWKDLPLAIYPGIEYACFSGSSLVEDDRVIAMYHGTKVGNMIATASDPLLLNWEKNPACPVIPLMPVSDTGKPYRVFDPFIWKEEDGYYALSGCFYGAEDARHSGDLNEMVEHLFFSQDLERWTYLGTLMDKNPLIEAGNDGACPYFWPIGNKHVLFFFSHRSGPYALVGDYDKVIHKFYPQKKVKFNFGPVGCSSLQAPCACPDGDGGAYLIFNTKDANRTLTRQGAMTLMIQVTLGEDGNLLFEPVSQISNLYGKQLNLAAQTLPAFKPQKLDYKGNAFELELDIDIKDARAVTIHVLASPDKSEYTAITLYKSQMNRGGTLTAELFVSVDTTYSSLLPEVESRIPETTKIDFIPGKPVNLRIFVDKSMVEVFANKKNYLMQMVYPSSVESTEVSVMALGNRASADISLREIKPMQR